MNFGVYIHIPYCLQRCSYCDFATYEKSQILPPDQYVELVKSEIRFRLANMRPRTLTSIYFGGGTPSLLPAEHILSLIDELEKHGFTIGQKTEVTLEINPATIDERKMQQYLGRGINRFSVGAQTFDNQLLKFVRREHNAEQTMQTLNLLRSLNVNYSFDLLFALPGQRLADLQIDVEKTLEMSPNHISPYCLTVPSSHPLAKGRPLESIQLEMFDLIDQSLSHAGYNKYEISNFSKPGFESRHNELYWSDDEYLGFGLSAHSYLKNTPFGTRFWNHRNIQDYENWVRTIDSKQAHSAYDLLPSENVELLLPHQALTDFCHTSLRRRTGLDLTRLENKFGTQVKSAVSSVLRQLLEEGLVEVGSDDSFRLSERGVRISNQIFERLTYLKDDLPT